MEESSFREVHVGKHGEAQQPLVQACWCSRRRKKAVILCFVTYQTHFARAVRAIASKGRLGFERATTNQQSESPSDRKTQCRRRLTLPRTIDNAKTNEPWLLRTFLTCFVDSSRDHFVLTLSPFYDCRTENGAKTFYWPLLYEGAVHAAVVNEKINVSFLYYNRWTVA